MRQIAIVLVLLALVGVGGFSPFSSASTAQMMLRGLVVQESGAAVAAQYGVPMAAKGWPANRGWSAINQELLLAEQHDVRLMVGLMWQNETYTGAPSALPAHWDKVCWGGGFAGCGPNYANPVTRGQALQLIRDFATRYDGHAQIAGIMAAVGDDRERRFCKDPQPGSACRNAYDAVKLSAETWRRFVADVINVYASSFTKTPVVFHFSGFGFANWELDRDSRVAVDAGLGLMSSGLYPQNCPGNSYGGHCNPLSPLLTDWMVTSIYRDSFVAMEQSLAYTGDEAALAWLNAVTHGAEQIHAQRGTLLQSIGTEWRETAEYMLANPAAAIWVARDATARPCKATYCPEQGNWSRGVIEATYGELGLDVAPGYMGLVTRRGPVTLTTGIIGSVQVLVVLANGDRLVGHQDSGEVVHVGTTEYIHRVEVRLGPVPVTVTPAVTETPTWTPILPVTWTPTGTETAVPTDTPTPIWTPTDVPTLVPTPTSTRVPTDTPTPEATGPPSGWTVKGQWGYFGKIDLVIRPFWE